MRVRNKLKKQPQLVQDIYEYLYNLHTGLWAEWQVSDEEGRLKAAKWFADQMSKMAKYVDKETWDEIYEGRNEVVVHKNLTTRSIFRDDLLLHVRNKHLASGDRKESGGKVHDDKGKEL